MKLISMTDFILKIDGIEPKAVNFSSITDIRNYQLNSYSKIVNYANFLKQPLKLGMFIPCDENEESLNYQEIKQSVIDGTETWDIWYNAQERLIFKGFELVEVYKYGALLEMNFDDFSEKTTILFEDTIEGLLTYSFNPIFELTDSAIKQFNI